MTEDATSAVISYLREHALSRASAIKGDISAALTGDALALPLHLLELTISHAAAVVARQVAEEAVLAAAEASRDAFQVAAKSQDLALYKVAQGHLADAKRDLRGAQVEERIWLGGLTAIRARIDLITAGVVRTNDEKHIAHADPKATLEAYAADSSAERPW